MGEAQRFQVSGFRVITGAQLLTRWASVYGLVVPQSSGWKDSSQRISRLSGQVKQDRGSRRSQQFHSRLF